MNEQSSRAEELRRYDSPVSVKQGLRKRKSSSPHRTSTGKGKRTLAASRKQDALDIWKGEASSHQSGAKSGIHHKKERNVDYMTITEKSSRFNQRSLRVSNKGGKPVANRV